MLSMWAISGALAYFLLGLPFWIAMVIGAIVTPTDPILASSIVTGDFAEEILPERLRHMLSAESGANDGLAYLVVFLPLLLLTRPPEDAAIHWLTRTLLWEVVLAIPIGAAIGWAAGMFLDWIESKRRIESASLLAYTVALSLFVLGAVKLLGSDGILAVFAAGIAFSRVSTREARIQEYQIQEAVNRFFALPIFALFGLLIPWPDWASLGWAALALPGFILLLRRLPVMLLGNQLLGPVGDVRNAMFLGWFGPIGIAALYYSTLAGRHVENSEICPISSLIIFSSIIVHGVTATPFTQAYARLSSPARKQQIEGRGRDC
jgi:sodium/hydrogen antiporter